MAESKVCIVIVTYGDRLRFLAQVVERALSFNQVVQVVVVNNASISPLNFTDPKVLLLDNSENEGSAGGYHKGIKYAFEQVDCDFIWLLDDDIYLKKAALISY